MGKIRVGIGKTARFTTVSGRLFTSLWEKRFLCRSAVLGRGHWDVSTPELDPMTHGSSIISIFELGPSFEIQPFILSSMGICFLNIIFMNSKSAFQYPIQALSVLRREVTFHPIQLTINESLTPTN